MKGKFNSLIHDIHPGVVSKNKLYNALMQNNQILFLKIH
jgi:hypothetical protein